MSEKSKSNFEVESPPPLIENPKAKKSIFGLSALLNLLGKIKFLNKFYQDEKGKTNWLKIVRNILLLYIGIYYLGILRDTFNNNIERGLFFGESVDGLVMLGYLILCIILFLPIIFFTTYFGKYGKIIAFCFFVLLIGIYIHNISYCINPVCLLNPIIFLPLILSFILIFKNTKNFNQFFIVLFLIPSAIIVTNDMFSRMGITKFHDTCHREFIQEEYHPLFLSRDYFKEKEIDGKTVLKAAVSKTSFVPFVERNIIQDLGWCYPPNKDIDVFLESGYIVICREAHKNQWKLRQILQDHKVKTLAKINTSQYYWSYGWLNKLLRTEPNMYMCGEHKIYYNGDINVVPYENYIKLKKNTNVKEVN